MKYKIAISVIAYCLGITFPLSATATMPERLTEQAQTLMTKENYEGAYELLAPVADDYSEDAEFNYWYGKVLLKLQKYTLAVFALERAVLVRPDHLQAKQALAQGYTEIGEYARAGELSAQINAAGISSTSGGIMQTLKQLFQPADGSYKLSGFLSSTSGYDSNLTSGPTDSYITIPVARSYGPIFVGRNLQNEGDFFTSVNGSANLDVKLSDQYGLNMGMYGSHRLNKRRPDEDLAFLSGWLGGHYQQGKNRYDVNFRRQSIWLSEEDYQDQWGVLGQWSRALQANTTLALYAQASTLRYPNATNLDADSYLLGTVLHHQLDLLWTPLISAELYGGELRVNAEGDTYEGYASIGGRLTNQFHITENNELTIMGAVEDRQYKAENIYFITTRGDRGYSVTGKFSHSLFNKQLAVSVQGTWLLNESNVELYDYKRKLAAVNVQWNF